MMISVGKRLKQENEIEQRKMVFFFFNWNDFLIFDFEHFIFNSLFVQEKCNYQILILPMQHIKGNSNFKSYLSTHFSAFRVRDGKACPILLTIAMTTLDDVAQTCI